MGRTKKALSKKIENRTVTCESVLPLPDELNGMELPGMKEFLSAEQKIQEGFCVAQICTVAMLHRILK